MLPLTALKNGLGDIVSLNNSLTMTAEAMNTTVSNIQQIATGSQQIAISMGASVKDVLDIAHIYANVSESQATIMAQTKSTVELMNISGMSGSDATNALQGVQQAFNLTANDLQHVDDVMATIASHLKENYQTAIQNISSAVSISGTMAQQAGLTI